MAPTQVLKFSRSDDDSACVLIQATSKGSKPLDLKLVATEGEAPYVCTLKHDRVDGLRVKGCPASSQEWQDILLSIFQRQHREDIQVTATIQSESSISLTVRKQIQGITQRLGAITLTYDADEAIELFEWCAAAVDSAVNSNSSAAEATEKSQSLEDKVRQLQAQLNELVESKRDDEAALLVKFRDLLNEKKVKIREQQKIMAASSPNSSATLSGEQAAASAAPSRKAAPSKPGKRKAKATEAADTPVDEDGDEDVDMDVEIKHDPDDSDPGATTEETASDEGDVEEADVAQPQQEAPKQPPPKKETNKPPVRRNLPFQNKKPAPAADDSDDEL